MRFALKIKLMSVVVFAALFSACSSPLKYQPRDNSGLHKTTQPKQQQQKRVAADVCNWPYKVQSGDTLSGIAYRCDISMRALAKQNELLPPYIIYIGQPLDFDSNFTGNDSVVKAKKVVVAENLADKPLVTQPVEVKKIAKTKPKPVVEQSAKAIAREPISQKTVAKSGKWQWPMHKGLDYRFRRDKAGLSVLEVYGVPGQEVKAVTSGKVVYAGNGIVNYGWMLVIKHTNDYMSIYAHNSNLLVKEGDVIDTGQVVAYMGATGNTNRPKLYLEARYQGRKIDIKKVLKR